MTTRKTTDNEAFVRKVQAHLGVAPDGWAGAGTNRAWEAKYGLVVPTAPAGMKASKRAIDLIHSMESFRANAYKDPGSKDGLPITIGWGSTSDLFGQPIKLGTVWTREQAVASPPNLLAGQGKGDQNGHHERRFPASAIAITASFLMEQTRVSASPWMTPLDRSPIVCAVEASNVGSHGARRLSGITIPVVPQALKLATVAIRQKSVRPLDFIDGTLLLLCFHVLCGCFRRHRAQRIGCHGRLSGLADSTVSAGFLKAVRAV